MRRGHCFLCRTALTSTPACRVETSKAGTTVGRKERVRPNVDDVGFIKALLDWAADRFSNTPVTLDMGQILVTGASNGGMITCRLDVERPSRVSTAAAFT